MTTPEKQLVRRASILQFRGKTFVSTINRTVDGLGIVQPPQIVPGEIRAESVGAAVRRALDATILVPRMPLSSPALSEISAQLARAYGGKSIAAVYRECSACVADLRDGRLTITPQGWDGRRMLIESEEDEVSLDPSASDVQLGEAVLAALAFSPAE